MAMNSFQLHAHRGCPSLIPENTLAGFKKAIDSGARVLELDVVVSKDHKLVVSHDPYMRGDLCLDPNGASISEMGQWKHNIYEMTFDQVLQYDVGSVKSAKFPDQEKGRHVKPTFLELAKMVAEHPGVKLNIEVKSDRNWYGKFQPEASVYAMLVKQEFGVLREMNVPFMVQSFDAAFLNELYALDSLIEYGLLVEGELNIEEQLDLLTFRPSYFNPDHQLINESTLKNLKNRGLLVVPWTVNDLTRAHVLKKMGADGLITDYIQMFIGRV
jgi:glycerophosphoryl diester phosphodiesterase